MRRVVIYWDTAWGPMARYTDEHGQPARRNIPDQTAWHELRDEIADNAGVWRGGLDIEWASKRARKLLEDY